jgi:hypothetical protein
MGFLIAATMAALPTMSAVAGIGGARVSRMDSFSAAHV